MESIKLLFGYFGIDLNKKEEWYKKKWKNWQGKLHLKKRFKTIEEEKRKPWKNWRGTFTKKKRKNRERKKNEQQTQKQTTRAKKKREKKKKRQNSHFLCRTFFWELIVLGT